MPRLSVGGWIHSYMYLVVRAVRIIHDLNVMFIIEADRRCGAHYL